MRRERRGISSIYGFIMIFLLSMASIQTWSSAIGSLSELQAASDKSRQIEQTQGLEHLLLSLSYRNLTITNDGQVPSILAYLRVVSTNGSRTTSLAIQLQVGGSTKIPLSGATDAVEIITSLGNVFMLAPEAADPPAPEYWSGGAGGGPWSSDLQIYRNTADPSVFFLGSGSIVYAFSTSGNQLWTFDSGQGSVTDVMPLASGDVYVSVGYAYSSNAAELFKLDSSGREIASFPVRLDQFVGSGISLAPVSKGVDSDYAFYDGFFYAQSGPGPSLPSDGFPLATYDSAHFYFYQSLGVGGPSGSCEGTADEVKLSSFTPIPFSSSLDWTSYFYLPVCGFYPPQLLAATGGSGIVATLFSEEGYASSNGSQDSSSNPYLFVVSEAGDVLYDGEMAAGSYSSSLASDGTDVFLALPQSDQLQVVRTADQSTTTYNIGFPASKLVWAFGWLFAASSTELKVYGPGMNLTKTLSFAPLNLASFLNAFPQEQSLHDPSFIPLNSTSYAALLENSTGYATLVIGKYT